MSSEKYNGNVNEFELPSELTAQQRQVLEAIANGATIKQATADAGVTMWKLSVWRSQPVFGPAFVAARSVKNLAKIDSLDEMRDETLWPDVQRAKLMSDNIKWSVSRENRAEYGDRVDVEVTQRVDVRLALDDARRRVLRPIRDLDAIEDAEFTEESTPCVSGPRDKQSLPAIPAVEDVPQPDIFS
jgi:hypothetical protein